RHGPKPWASPIEKIGRPAHEHVQGGPDNRLVAAHAHDVAAVLRDVRDWTARPAPSLEDLERTLADGYACAHAIEAERRRMRELLEDGAARLGQRPSQKRVGELAGLGEGLARTGAELTELRAALVELAEKARTVRAA